MAQKSQLTLSEDTKNLIMETSAIGGYAQNIVKEILEFLLVDWSFKLADNPDGYADLVIPYLGTVRVKYKGDEIISTGELKTITEEYVVLSDQFKKLVGDIHDEGISAIESMLDKKIKNAILVAAANE